MQLSIVIPAYNEAARIETTLKAIEAYLARQTYDAEVLLVDDGSEDATVEVARQALPSIRVIAYQPNRGKGYAVKRGMLEAVGRYRMYTDADASTPIEEMDRFWPAFDAGAAVVIGSRAMVGSDIAIRQPWHREAMGRMFNQILRVIALTPYRDTQCGFKAFTAEAAEAVFPLQQSEGFAADVEILYIAARLGLPVAEIPVQWRNSADSRVRLHVDPPAMFLDALRVRYRAIRGAYPSKSSRS